MLSYICACCVPWYLHRDILHKNIYIYNTHGNASFVYAAGDTNSIFNVLLMAYDDHPMGNCELYITTPGQNKTRFHLVLRNATIS